MRRQRGREREEEIERQRERGREGEGECNRETETLYEFIICPSSLCLTLASMSQNKVIREGKRKVQGVGDGGWGGSRQGRGQLNYNILFFFC